jgi:hypothetical protein
MGTRIVPLSDDEILFIKNILPMANHYDISKKILSKFDRSQHRISPASAKSKGRTLQVWVCQKIAALLGVSWSNSDDESPVASRPMGQHGCDVILRGDARKKFIFDLECKASKELRISDAVKQAESNAASGRMPAVVYKQTGADPVVVLSWDTFEQVCKYLL